MIYDVLGFFNMILRKYDTIVVFFQQFDNQCCSDKNV